MSAPLGPILLVTGTCGVRRRIISLREMTYCTAIRPLYVRISPDQCFLELALEKLGISTI
ncbi:MAG: hypothetical protein ACC612_03505 [Methanomethylovorans sp.]|uniref:hypothetical protein n=1 Tax=Methanomethylovorans sp. TaxID=2758717 RepID=UPI003530C44E